MEKSTSLLTDCGRHPLHSIKYSVTEANSMNFHRSAGFVGQTRSRHQVRKPAMDGKILRVPGLAHFQFLGKIFLSYDPHEHGPGMSRT